MKQSDRFRENADNCAELAMRATEEPSQASSRRMEEPYAVFASDLLLRDDPVSHLRPLSPRATLQGSAATKSTRS
jgi:hypothetical protein